MTTSADTREKVQPVALAHICSTDTYPDIKLEVLDGSLLQPEHSPVPLYAALQPDAGLEGWRLVPVEPTPAMLKAGRYHWGPWLNPEKTERAGRYDDGDSDIRNQEVWEQMLSAAPPPPMQPTVGEDKCGIM
jgi:hypothetical protein